MFNFFKRMCWRIRYLGSAPTLVLIFKEGTVVKIRYVSKFKFTDTEWTVTMLPGFTCPIRKLPDAEFIGFVHHSGTLSVS